LWDLALLNALASANVNRSLVVLTKKFSGS